MPVAPDSGQPTVVRWLIPSSVYIDISKLKSAIAGNTTWPINCLFSSLSLSRQIRSFRLDIVLLFLFPTSCCLTPTVSRRTFRCGRRSGRRSSLSLSPFQSLSLEREDDAVSQHIRRGSVFFFFFFLLYFLRCSCLCSSGFATRRPTSSWNLRTRPSGISENSFQLLVFPLPLSPLSLSYFYVKSPPFFFFFGCGDNTRNDMYSQFMRRILHDRQLADYISFFLSLSLSRKVPIWRPGRESDHFFSRGHSNVCG